MKITWNPEEKRFETAPSPTTFYSDKESLSQAGMKCTGPPTWIWWTGKSATLSALRKLATGMTISPEARQNYDRLLAQETANAAILKQLKEARKAQKRAEVETGPEIDWDSIEPTEEIHRKYVPPSPPSIVCTVCCTPVYYYESQDPPLCLDCEFADEF
jgi:hypothetical protein